MTFVYFAYCEQVQAVKIGKARDVKSRLSMLQIGNPLSMELVDVIEDNGGKLEGLLHRWFRDRRIRGEWFKIAPDEVRELVAKIKEQGTAFLDVKCLKTSTQKRGPRQRRTDPWSDMIRQQARLDSRSQAAIAASAGMTQAQLSRFLSGQRQLTMNPFGRLAQVLGFEIVTDRAELAHIPGLRLMRSV